MFRLAVRPLTCSRRDRHDVQLAAQALMVDAEGRVPWGKKCSIVTVPCHLPSPISHPTDIDKTLDKLRDSKSAGEVILRFPGPRAPVLWSEIEISGLHQDPARCKI